MPQYAAVQHTAAGAAHPVIKDQAYYIAKCGSWASLPNSGEYENKISESDISGNAAQGSESQDPNYPPTAPGTPYLEPYNGHAYPSTDSVTRSASSISASQFGLSHQTSHGQRGSWANRSVRSTNPPLSEHYTVDTSAGNRSPSAYSFNSTTTSSAASLIDGPRHNGAPQLFSSQPHTVSNPVGVQQPNQPPWSSLHTRTQPAHGWPQYSASGHHYPYSSAA